MELELQIDYLNCYSTLLETTICQEETLESIVPDAFPDLLYIVDTEATVCLTSKEVQDGRVVLAGDVVCAILYCPEGGDGVRHLRASIPFSCHCDVPGDWSSCRVVAQPRIQACDTRSLNPRKILTRVSLTIDVTVFSSHCEEICTHVNSEGTEDVAQLIEEDRTYVVVAVEEKPFTFSDDLALPTTRQPAEELLKTRVDLVCTESKVIGNKLIFKGEANLQVLYRDTAGGIYPSRFELPISQIIEVAGVEEGAVCTVEVILNRCICTLDGGESHTLSVALSMLAQAVVREERQVKLLADAYSINGLAQPEWRHYGFQHLVAQETRRVNMREVIETTIPVREICDVHICLGQLEKSHAGCEVGTTATILYWGEDGNLTSVTQHFTATCNVDLPEGCHVVWGCKTWGEGFATPVGGGLEVRYTIDLPYLALLPHDTSGISRLNMEEAVPSNAIHRPSVVLRMVGAGERLWDVAKAYNTTMDDIIQANGLTDGTLPMGELLLIPKKR